MSEDEQLRLECVREVVRAMPNLHDGAILCDVAREIYDFVTEQSRAAMVPVGEAT